MFDITPENLEWAFRKFKSYYHYYFGSLYLKEKIKKYEDNFKKDPTYFEKLSQKLNSYSSTDRLDYGIDYIIYPKKKAFSIDNNVLRCESINVFIDMDIDLFLVDVLFSMNIIEKAGYIINRAESYGGRFDSRLDEDDKMHNLFLVENYRRSYSSWKNLIKGLNSSDSPECMSILKLDLEKCYYNCSFDFSNVVNKLDISNEKSTIIMKSVYNIYTSILCNRVLKTNKRTRATLLPLGLISSIFMLNYLFKGYDELILSKTNTIYKYGRYVDDMIIVLNKDYSDRKISEILKEIFGDSVLVSQDKVCFLKNEDIVSDIPLNISKCSICSFNKKDSPSLSLDDLFNSTSIIDFDDELRDNDPSFILNDLKNKIYEIKDQTSPDINFLNGYSDAILLDCYPIWREILKNDNHDFIYNKILKIIFKIHEVSSLIENKSAVAKLKKNLIDELRLSKLLSNIKAKDYNYLVNIDFHDINYYISQHLKNNDKSMFFPEIVSIANISLFLSMNYLSENKQPLGLIEKIKTTYSSINRVNNIYGYKIFNYKLTNYDDNKDLILLRPVDESTHETNKVNVSIAALSFECGYKDGKIINDYSKYDLSTIKKIMVETSKFCKGSFCYLLFPELSIEYSWLHDMVKIARSNRMSFICGLKHEKFVIGGHDVYPNITANYEYDSGIVLLKPKNYLPYEEKLAIINWYRGAFYEPPLKYYYIIDDTISFYSFMTCYEATNIVDRAMMADKINIMFMPVLNKDTNYFSNIVMSLSRDISCYVVQANSNVLGDSRVVFPTHSNAANIVRLKGGINNYSVIDKIDLEKLRKGHHDYISYLKKVESGLTKETYKGDIKPLSAGHHYKK